MTRGARGAVVGAAILMLMCTAFAEDVVEIADQTGATVQVPQPVERLASVYGAGTFYIYTLGASERLEMAWYIGVKGLAKASDAMFRLEPRLGEILAFGDPNVEEVVSRDVQLVLVDGSRHAAFADQITELGIPVIRYLVETPEQLKAAVLLTGEALGRDPLEKASRFVDDYDRLVASVSSDVGSISSDTRVRVLFLGTDLLRVASGDMYQTHLIEAAGGVSVSQDLSGYWNDVNLEQVLLWNPDVIVIPPYGPVQTEDILENADWAAINAVRQGRIHRMPRVVAPMDAPVPESLLGVAWMAKLFYPDLVHIDLSAEIERFYVSYYNYSLTEAELEHMAGQ